MPGFQPRNLTVEVEPLINADEYRTLHHTVAKGTVVLMGAYGATEVFAHTADWVADTVEAGATINAGVEDSIMTTARDLAQFNSEVADSLWGASVLSLVICAAMAAGRMRYAHHEKAERRYFERQIRLREQDEKQKALIAVVFGGVEK